MASLLGIDWLAGAHTNPSVLIGTFGVLVVVVAGVFAPLPFDPLGTDVGSSLQPPSLVHWFGTDRAGADVFSRTLRATRTDLPLALAGTAASLLIGVPLGLIAGWKRKGGERMMRMLDAFNAFPMLLLSLALVSVSGNRIELVIVAIALINFPRYMRLLRSEILSLRESRFIEAAIAFGASDRRLMFRHLLPNVRDLVIAQTSLTMAHSLVAISVLSFLGIGITPPTPSWGAMIRSGAQNMTSGEWWLAGFPGLALCVVVLSFNVIGQGLQNRGATGLRSQSRT